jgi:hypothetical protein
MIVLREPDLCSLQSTEEVAADEPAGTRKPGITMNFRDKMQVTRQVWHQPST